MKDVDELTNAMIKTLDDPSKSAAMGRSGRQIVVEKFSAHSMVEQMQGLYLGLARDKGLLAVSPAENER